MADKPVRTDKATAVAELTEHFRNSTATVLTEYRGLTVAQLKSLRRALGTQATYAVAKNTLAKRAAEDAGITGLDNLFSGPTALAFVSGDVVEAAKGLRDFAKAHPLLVIKGGVFEGKPLSAAEVTKLADLESREVLLAKLAGAMKANLSKAAATFQAPLTQAVRLVAALQAKREEDPGTTPAAQAAPAPLTRPRPRRPQTDFERGAITMAKMSTDQLLDAFKEMTLIELSEFVKQFEEVFDVKAAAPMAMAVAGPAGGGAAPEVVEEQDEFDVVLENDGGKKIQVIKVVRELTGLGLKEAKDLVEAAPKAVLEKANKENADKAKAKLEAEGAKVTLK